MRLKQYMLNEKIVDWSKVLKDCAPFIKELSRMPKGSFVYRHTKRSIKDFVMLSSHVKQGRTPRDIPEKLHNTLNKAFKKEFGWNVRDGVSTTGVILNLSTYGDPYIFLPIGKYSYVWSPKIDDLYQWTYFGDSSVMSVWGMKELSPESAEVLETVSLYTDKNLKGAVRSGSEIMFNCDRYYLIHPLQPHYESELSKHIWK